MKFKIDENLPIDAAVLLKNAGHDALTVYDENLTGCQDTDIAAVSAAESRILLTLDLGFANIRAYPPSKYPGIIVFRLSRQNKQNVLQAISRLLRVFDTHLVHNKLWIVEERRVRIRG
ncbi:MAG: DUF5615 family PIN-like protein [Anaerolineales bacterium]